MICDNCRIKAVADKLTVGSAYNLFRLVSDSLLNNNIKEFCLNRRDAQKLGILLDFTIVPPDDKPRRGVKCFNQKCKAKAEYVLAKEELAFCEPCYFAFSMAKRLICAACSK